MSEDLGKTMKVSNGVVLWEKCKDAFPTKAAATTAANGLLSAEDKAKLDTLSAYSVLTNMELEELLR